MKLTLHIPGVMRWELPDGWTREDRNLFLEGMRHAWLTDRTTPDNLWPKAKARGFLLGEKVLLFCDKHGLDRHRLTRTGINYGFAKHHQPDDSGRGREALFSAYTSLH